MNTARVVSVLMNSDLLTLSRACAVLRRRNMPVRGFTVDSHGPSGFIALYQNLPPLK